MTLKNYVSIIILLAFTCFVIASDQVEPTSGQVAYVVDGDTLRLESYEKSVRLWGVNAPERGRPGADRATMELQMIAGRGTVVSIVEMDQDHYQRIVGRVYLQDGREVNRLLIESGVAKEYCRYSWGEYGRCNANN